MLDPDAQPDRFRPHAGGELLVARHLTMGRARRVAGERLRVADVHQAFDEPERIVEPLSALIAAHDAEGEQRAGAAAEILSGERMIRAVGKADIVDPGDAGVAAQILRDTAAVL